MKFFSYAAATFLFVFVLISQAKASPRPLGKQASPNQVIDMGAKALLRGYFSGVFVKYVIPPPQIIVATPDNPIYASCALERESANTYCGSTNTIIIEKRFLTDLAVFVGDKLSGQGYRASPILFALFHEWGHFLQVNMEALGYRVPSGKQREIQADCFAGLLWQEHGHELGGTNRDLAAMGQTALSLGEYGNPESHGTAGERAGAFMAGQATYSWPKDKRLSMCTIHLQDFLNGKRDGFL